MIISGTDLQNMIGANDNFASSLCDALVGAFQSSIGEAGLTFYGEVSNVATTKTKVMNGHDSNVGRTLFMFNEFLRSDKTYTVTLKNKWNNAINQVLNSTQFSTIRYDDKRIVGIQTYNSYGDDDYLEITGAFGYDTEANCPKDVISALRLYAAQSYPIYSSQFSASSGNQLKSTNVGGLSVTYETTKVDMESLKLTNPFVNPLVSQILRKYAINQNFIF